MTLQYNHLRYLEKKKNPFVLRYSCSLVQPRQVNFLYFLPCIILCFLKYVFIFKTCNLFCLVFLIIIQPQFLYKVLKRKSLCNTLVCKFRICFILCSVINVCPFKCCVVVESWLLCDLFNFRDTRGTCSLFQFYPY